MTDELDRDLQAASTENLQRMGVTHRTSNKRLTVGAKIYCPFPEGQVPEGWPKEYVDFEAYYTETERLRGLLSELVPEGIREVCDECGGDDAKCGG
jgi:hypothetical protein